MVDAVTKSSRLEKFGIQFPFFVAPMVGLSHVAFRELVRSYTPEPIRPLIFTEMLSTRRIPSENLELADSLFVSDSERGYVIPQLLGNEEKFIAPSMERLMGINPWGFDINMGCPSKKTLNHNWGVLLMGDKKYASEVVRITKKNTSRPVSVKLRAGFESSVDRDYLIDFTDHLEKAGADWLTIHCRPKNQRHRGEARWDVVGELRKHRSIPVVCNGDLQTAEDAVHVLKEFQVDGAMFARAAAARPWILWQVQYLLDKANTPKPPLTPEEEGAEYYKAVLKHCDLLIQYFGETRLSLKRAKFFVGVGHRWLPFGHHFWKTLQTAESVMELADKVRDYSERHPQNLSRRISL